MQTGKFKLTFWPGYFVFGIGKYSVLEIIQVQTINEGVLRSLCQSTVESKF